MIIPFLENLYSGVSAEEMWRFGTPADLGEITAVDAVAAETLVAELTAAGRNAYLRSNTFRDGRPSRTFFVTLDVDLLGGAHKHVNRRPKGALTQFW